MAEKNSNWSFKSGLTFPGLIVTVILSVSGFAEGFLFSNRSFFTESRTDMNYTGTPGKKEKKPLIKPVIPKSGAAHAVVPFDCTPDFFFTIGGDPGEGTLSVVDQSNPNNMLDLFTYPFRMNGTGYNQFDNFIYTIGKTAPYQNHVMRLHGDGTFADLGDIGLPSDIVVGGFATDGLWYVKEGSNPEVYAIDVNSLTFTVISPSADFEGKDWAYNELTNKFYGADNYDMLFSFDPASGEVTSTTLSGMLPENGITFGAAFYAVDGYIYVYNNLSGYFYRIDVNTNQAFYVYGGPTDLSSVDGCSCPYSPPPIPVVYAENDTICITQPEGNIIEVLLNDEVNIANLDYNTLTIVENPTNGTVTYDNSTGVITYDAFTPMKLDSFKYSICCDGQIVTCDVATVYIFTAPEVTFDQLGDYCVGDIPENLPPVSNEGVEGSWSPPVINTSSAGTFDYVFTPDPDIYMCSNPYTMEVTVNPPGATTFDEIGPLCYGQSGVILPDQSQEGVLGTWTPSVINTYTAGTFEYIFIPDQQAFPCFQFAILEITVLPDIIINIVDTICASDLLTYDLMINITGGTGNYIVSADGFLVNDLGNGNFSISYITSGTDITIEVSDENECYATRPVTNITCNCPEIPLPSGAENGFFCYGDQPGTLSVNDPGILYEVVWTDINNNIVGNGIDFVPAGEGVYNVHLVNNENGCPGESVSVESIENEQIAVNVLTSVCNNENDPFDIEIEVSGGSSNFSVTAVGKTVIKNSTDNFSIINVNNTDGVDIVVTDGAGCILEETVYPSILDSPVSDLKDAVTISCEQNYILLSTSSNPAITSYKWFNAQKIQISDKSEISVDKAGKYYVLLTNNQTGCISEDSTEVFPPLYPEFQIQSVNVSCFGDKNGSISFTATGTNHPPYSYSVDGGKNFSDSTIFSGLGPGKYDIIVTTGSGCDVDTTITITEPELVNAIISGDKIISCSTGKAELKGSSNLTGMSYQWLNSNKSVISNQNDVQVQQAGKYYFVVKNNQTGCFDIDSITILPANIPDFGIDIKHVTCNGDKNGSIRFTTSPGNTQNLSFSIDNGSSFNANKYYGSLNGGVYHLIVTTGGDCVVDTIVKINEPDPVVAKIKADPAISCVTGKARLISLSHTTGQNIQWLDAGNQIVSGQNEFETTKHGKYYLIVKDNQSGCFSKDSVIVLPADIPVFDIETENVTCHGDKNGSIKFIVAPDNFQKMTFSIDNGVSFYDLKCFASLNGGTYHIKVTTGGDCTVDTTVFLTEPGPVIANIKADKSISCITGKAKLLSQSHAPGQIIQWWNSSNTRISESAQIEVDKPGKYYLVVSDNISGCLSKDSVIIDPAVFPEFDLLVDNKMCYGERSGSIKFVPISSGQSYLFSIDNASSYSTKSFYGNLGPGKYYLSVKTGSDCRIDTFINIIELPQIKIELEPFVEIELGDEYQINTKTNINSGSIQSIVWSPEEGLSCNDCLNPLAKPLKTTVYNIELIDTSGCKADSEITIKVNSEIIIDIPNIFSPNDDNINDKFYVKSKKRNFKIEDLRIFDRWGELIYQASDFSTNDKTFGWNGKKGNTDLNPGVYVYVIKIKMPDDRSEVYSGDITLIR